MPDLASEATSWASTFYKYGILPTCGRKHFIIGSYSYYCCEVRARFLLLVCRLGDGSSAFACALEASAPSRRPSSRKLGGAAVGLPPNSEGSVLLPESSCGKPLKQPSSLHTGLPTIA